MESQYPTSILHYDLRFDNREQLRYNNETTQQWGRGSPFQLTTMISEFVTADADFRLRAESPADQSAATDPLIKGPYDNLYFLDEPTTGLHFVDIDRLLIRPNVNGSKMGFER